ncbi:MAG: gliding motility protein GldM [Bacteroidales bacterium]|nr:gliding motility protein GldM [Bacteroidales bacterium]
MSAPKETPRQKMIGMMYLFYTALLALNVSAEILAAFSLVDGSLRKTNEITDGVITDTQNEFVKAMVNDSASVAPFKTLADQVVIEANKAYDEIQHWKEQLVFTLEGVENEQQLREMHDGDQDSYIGDLVSKKDDNNVGGQIFILEGHGKDIMNSRNSYRDFLINIIKQDTSTLEANVKARQSLIHSISEMLSTAKTVSKNGGDADSIDWDVANFDQLPAAGVLALMTKMQADVRNTESSMLSYLLGQIGKSDMKFNAIKAVVNAPSNYVLQGQPFKAEVFIAAYDSLTNPDMILNGGTALTVEKGVGIYNGNTQSIGVHPWGGVIKLKNKSTGEIKEYPFSSTYEVGTPSVSVSPTKMNVFYIGVDNPVEISASGVPSEKVSASISGGSIRRKSGADWIVNVKSPGEVTVNCSANIDGQTRSLGHKKFRVKRVPDPMASVGTGENKRGGIIAKNSLINQVVRAEMENFDFDLKFVVTGFSVSATVKGFTKTEESRSGQFTAAQKQLISGVPSGGKVYIEDVKAKGPDGSTRNLNTIKFTVR